MDDLASRTRIDTSNIRSYESGRALVGLQSLVRIAAELGVEPGSLLEGIERYWKVLDRLEAAKPRSRDRKRAALAYLRLCEDQCDLRQQDRVTDETWASWGPSIHDELSLEEFAVALAEEPKELLVHLRQMKTTGATYDPTEMPIRLRV